MGYIMGKAEGKGEQWHGHVTAVTVAPAYRRQGLARTLMGTLEETTEKMYATHFFHRQWPTLKCTSTHGQ